MPELPDITVYVERLAALFGGCVLERVRVRSPSLLRTADPPLDAVFGRRLVSCSRLGKRIVLSVEGDLHLVLHLMIAGRLHRKPHGAPVPGKIGLACFDFERETLALTEASSHKRAQLHLVRGADGLHAHDPGGLEIIGSTLEDFAAALTREGHTLKRALTDPRLLSGIGNAYSDEILHHARLSPVKLSRSLSAEEMQRLHASTEHVLRLWTDRLRAEVGAGFPEKVTAFREGMAVHGRYGKPCPDCGMPVQRIVRADSETNYCAQCQTGHKLLADRALSRLLKQDWPKTLAELEEHKAAALMIGATCAVPRPRRQSRQGPTPSRGSRRSR